VSANLINSTALAADGRFNGLVRAAIVEYALAHPNDALARSMVRDPAYLLPMFVSVVADNPTISADGWQTASPAQQQTDVRYALAQTWASLASVIPNVEPTTGRVPVLDADPPTTSALSIWVISTTGDLHVRDAADAIHSYPAGT
jgi:hypothetical protein